MTLLEMKEMEFCTLLEQAQTDNEALETLITLLEPDMCFLSRYIKQPKEDSIQQLKMAFIEVIREGQIK